MTKQTALTLIKLLIRQKKYVFFRFQSEKIGIVSTTNIYLIVHVFFLI